MELGHIFEKIALGVEAAAVGVIVVGIIIGTSFGSIMRTRLSATTDMGWPGRSFYPLSFWWLPISSAPWRLTKRASKESASWDSSSSSEHSWDGLWKWN